ncbi:MAG: cadherin-like domain-containing protein, partial [Planctomycetes bacterium]|nr:cadherin-like domain-containing protein [Planctomycetota bacterium]
SIGVDVIKVISVRVNALNDAPDIRLAGDSNPAAPAIGGAVEDHDLPITSIDILDPDVVETLNGKLFVTMSVTDGILHLSESISGGLQTSNISGNHTDSVILQAAPDRINQTLTAAGGLIFEPASGFAGNAVLEIHADDQGLTGAGNVLTDSMTITITVQSENDAPVVTVPGPQATDEDQSLGIGGIRVDDEDSASDPVQVTLSVPLGKGTLTVNSAVAGNGTNQITLTGNLATINSVLSDPAGVVYQPADDDYGLVNLIVTADDQGHNGDGGPQQGSGTIPITIRSVNDQPTIDLPGNETVAEDLDLVFSQAAGNAIVVGDVEAAVSGDVRLHLTVNRGRLTVSTNVSGGVAAQDIVGNGTATLILTGAPGEINTTLASGLTYRGNLNYNGNDTLTATVNDLGNSGAGGPQIAQASLAIQVTPVNDPPTATNDTVATQEDVVLTIAPAALTANDSPGPSDEANQGIQLVSVNAASPQHGTVSFNGTNVVYTPQLNFNGVDTFTYTINDGDANSTAVGTVTVNVSAVNDPPVPVNDSFSTDEDVVLSLNPNQLIGNDAPGPLAPSGTLDPETSQTLTL